MHAVYVSSCKIYTSEKELIQSCFNSLTLALQHIKSCLLAKIKLIVHKLYFCTKCNTNMTFTNCIQSQHKCSLMHTKCMRVTIWLNVIKCFLYNNIINIMIAYDFLFVSGNFGPTQARSMSMDMDRAWVELQRKMTGFGRAWDWF